MSEKKKHTGGLRHFCRHVPWALLVLLGTVGIVMAIITLFMGVAVHWCHGGLDVVVVGGGGRERRRGEGGMESGGRGGTGIA